MGITGDLNELLSHYLRDRKLRVVYNGKESKLYNINAGVPQGSILGPLLWNIYINDLLHLVPEVKAFADDCTLAISYSPLHEVAAITQLNERLKEIAEWGDKWQVKCAPHKTQLMVISRSETSQTLQFNREEIRSQNEIEILGVIYDNKLTYRSHIDNIARKASAKITSLRKISSLIDKKGRELLYKSQVRAAMEYSCLAWGGAANTHLRLLDRVQKRAIAIIEAKSNGQTMVMRYRHRGNRTINQTNNYHRNQVRDQIKLDSLQHRRDVAGLSVMYKTQYQHTQHLQYLRLPPRHVGRTTRTVEAAPAALDEPRCRTSHYQRQYLPKYCKIFNDFICVHRDVAYKNTHHFKCIANQWLKDET